jgi:hypothetical protein
MYILTNRELEFLVLLQTNWRRYYLNEIARLMAENGEENPQISASSVKNPAFRLARAEALP